MARQLQTTPYSGTFDGALKHWYEPRLKDMLSDYFAWYDWLKKEKRIDRNPRIEGDYIVFGTNVKRSSAVGARGEMDTLPTVDKAQIVQGTIDYMTGFKGRIAVSAEVMKYGRQGKGSFANIVEHEMDQIEQAMKECGSVAAWSNGDGVCGRTADASAATAQKTFTSSELSTACYPGTRWLHEGHRYIPVQSTAAYAADVTMTASVADGAGEILSIDSDLLATFAAVTQTDAAARLWVEAETATNGSVTVGTAASYRGPMGFLAAVDDGTFKTSYCGISESTYPRWMSQVLANGGVVRALTVKLFYQAFFKTLRKSGSRPDFVAWTSPDVLIEFADLLTHHVEFRPRKLESGFEEMDVMVDGSVINIKTDPYCPTYIFLINPKEISLYETIPIEVADEHGSEWFPLANQDGYEARVRWNWQLATKARNKHACIMDLDVPISTM